jgi:hypothetical protein
VEVRADIFSASLIQKTQSGNTESDMFHHFIVWLTESVTGEKELPINIVVSAEDDAQLVRAFRTIGWLRADNIGLRSLAKTFRAAFFGSVYATAPMRPMFWDARASDFCFEMSAEINSWFTLNEIPTHFNLLRRKP